MIAQKMIDATKILQRKEIATVLADCKRRGKRSANTRQNEIIFRLATCCGLRVSEIVGLTLANVVTGTARPHIAIPKAIGKGNKARKVPLHWDRATLEALAVWKQERQEQGAKPSSPFVCSQAKGKHGKTGEEMFGKPLTTRNAQHRWDSTIEKSLGKERAKMLSIHCGRHSFCSHALAGGRSIVEVRDAAGHANISTTSIYLHAVKDDSETVGSLFEF